MEKWGTKHKDTKKRRRAGRGSRKEETAERERVCGGGCNGEGRRSQ